MDRSFVPELAVPEQGFTFCSLHLEPDGTLLRGDETIHLTPKELAALRLLLTYAGRIVTPAQLKEALWPDVHVTADSVPRCISSLRSRLGSEVEIRTLYKRGYRLESHVRRHSFSELDALPRLAIVPFTCGAFVAEHLGPAIAEDVAAHLRSFHPPIVRVVARDSVCTLSSLGFSVQEIGRKMDADLVLTGAVQTSTLFLRVRAEMTRMADKGPIWVEEVLGPLNNLPQLQRQLLEHVASRLGAPIDLSICASDIRSAQASADSSACEAFVVGRHQSRSHDPLRMSQAVELLMKATNLSPDNQAAREHLVRVSINQCLWGYVPPATAAEQVRQAADAIPETKQEFRALLPALGWMLFHMEHNLGFAVRMCDGGTSAEHSSFSTVLRAMLALSRHRCVEARDLLEEGLRDDPWSPTLHALLTWAHHLAGEAQDSLEQAEHGLAMFSGDERVELCAALILAYNGDPDRAAELAHRVAQRRPLLAIAAAIEAYALARAKRAREANEVLERLQWLGHERYVLRSFSAAAYAALGETGAAVAELRAAEDAHCPWFFQTLLDPRLRTLAGNPEFQRMRRISDDMEATVITESECTA